MIQNFTYFAAEAPKADLFTSLGIDWKMLIFQGVAFIILVFLLGKFVFPILIKSVDDRQAKIEDTAKAAAEAKPSAPAEAGPAYVGIDDFARLDLRIGKVLECGFVEGSDKLLRFLLDAGDLGQRQIFSGIRASYGEPETLVGRSVA